jgi:hypothetical protein
MLYAARTGNSWFAVVDGKESEASYEDIDLGKYSFSPDSKRLAYPVASGGKGFMIVDGKEEKRYVGVGMSSTVFSPNNQRLVYIAVLKGSVHSHEGEEKDKKEHLNEEEVCVVVDGSEGNIYRLIWEAPVFSPDSKLVAYLAMEKESWFLVKDGTKYPQKYDAVGRGTLIFSPDSKYVAYVAKSGEKWAVGVDGQAGKQYDGIITLLGGKVVFDSNDRLRYIAVEGGKVLLVEEKITERSAKP